jgi:hypothetical protein
MESLLHPRANPIVPSVQNFGVPPVATVFLEPRPRKVPPTSAAAIRAGRPESVFQVRSFRLPSCLLYGVLLASYWCASSYPRKIVSQPLGEYGGRRLGS